MLYKEPIFVIVAVIHVVYFFVTFFLFDPYKFTLCPSSSIAVSQWDQVPRTRLCIQAYLSPLNLSSSTDRFVWIVVFKRKNTE